MLHSVIDSLSFKNRRKSFYTTFKVPRQSAGLLIEGLGKLKFPLTPKAAKALIERAHPAHYGYKDQTLLDPAVRNCWEISAKDIVPSPEWTAVIESTLGRIATDLNLAEESRLSAHLHNILIYEKGQFFAAHQDSEKLLGMIATLVVLLPSRFTGGELMVDQHGDRKSLRPSAYGDELEMIAFYADCHHAVEKVRAGYRIAMTYNLVLENPPQRIKTKKNSKLAQSLDDYFSTPPAKSFLEQKTKYLVYLLDHQYTRKSLKWSGLKGQDRNTAEQLLGVADALGLEAHLALADIHEVWEAEAKDFDPYSYSRHRRYWNDDDQEEDEDDDFEDASKDADDVLVRDKIEDECTLNHWIDRAGRPAKLQSQYINNSMVCWSKATHEFKPLRTEYEGYMGNYGNTVDKWYHRAAMVLWRKDQHFAALFENDSATALTAIAALCKTDLDAARDAVQQILPQWTLYPGMRIEDPAIPFKLAAQLDDRGLAQRLLAHISLTSISKRAVPQLLRLIEQYGESWCVEQIKRWGRNEKKRMGSNFIENLDHLVSALWKTARGAASALLTDQASKIVAYDQAMKTQGQRWLAETKDDRLGVARDFLTAARVDPDIQTQMLEHMLSSSHSYQPNDLAELAMRLNGVEKMKDSLMFKTLTTETIKRLSEVVANKRPKNDWSIHDAWSCRCADCKILARFLNSSTETTLTWPLAKHRRQHIHNVIEELMVPVRHVTQRIGSPQKLILTKLPALFERDEKRVTQAEALIREVMGISRRRR